MTQTHAVSFSTSIFTLYHRAEHPQRNLNLLINLHNLVTICFRKKKIGCPENQLRISGGYIFLTTISCCGWRHGSHTVNSTSSTQNVVCPRESEQQTGSYYHTTLKQLS